MVVELAGKFRHGLQSDLSDILSLLNDFTIDQMLIFRPTSSFESVCEIGATVINPLIRRMSTERKILLYELTFCLLVGWLVECTQAKNIYT